MKLLLEGKMRKSKSKSKSKKKIKKCENLFVVVDNEQFFSLFFPFPYYVLNKYVGVYFG